MAPTFDIIRRIICDRFAVAEDRVTPDTLLAELSDDTFHALDIAELIMDLEDAFHIRIYDSEFPARVRGIVDFVAEKLK